MLFDEIGAMLEEHGLLMRQGTIVDATIIAAPSSTKDKSRDPEMHQTRKGKQWYFGMKAHIGVDVASGVVHTVIGTAANEANISGAAARPGRKAVFADAGDTGADKRPEPRCFLEQSRLSAASSRHCPKCCGTWPGRWSGRRRRCAPGPSILLGWFYPGVEIAALIMALIALAVDDMPRAVLACLFGWWLLMLAWIDPRRWLLPDLLTLPLLVAGLALAAMLDPYTVLDRALGAALGYIARSMPSRHVTERCGMARQSPTRFRLPPGRASRPKCAPPPRSRSRPAATRFS